MVGVESLKERRRVEEEEEQEEEEQEDVEGRTREKIWARKDMDLRIQVECF